MFNVKGIGKRSFLGEQMARNIGQLLSTAFMKLLSFYFQGLIEKSSCCLFYCQFTAFPVDMWVGSGLSNTVFVTDVIFWQTVLVSATTSRL